MDPNPDNDTRAASPSTGPMNRFVGADRWHTTPRWAMAGRYSHVDTHD
jgi:hypothetical protein